MAVLKTFTTRLGDKNYKSRIKAYASGYFAMRLPAPVAETLGIKKVTAETMCRVKQAFNDAIIKYKELLTVTRKVIAYRVATQAQIWRRGKLAVNSIALPYSRGSGYTLAVCVYIERVVKYSDSYTAYYYDVVVDQRIPEGFRNCGLYCNNRGDYKIVSWTKSLETSFVKECKAKEDAILRLVALSKVAEEDLTEALDT